MKKISLDFSNISNSDFDEIFSASVRRKAIQRINSKNFYIRKIGKNTFKIPSSFGDNYFYKVEILTERDNSDKIWYLRSCDCPHGRVNKWKASCYHVAIVLMMAGLSTIAGINQNIYLK